MEIKLTPVTNTPAQATKVPVLKPNTPKETKISITIPQNAYFMSGIRDFILQMVRNMTGFSDQWAYRFQAIVDELCNNAIEHGSGEGTYIHTTFIAHKGQYLEIIVEDTQTGKAKQTAESMYQLLEQKKQDIANQKPSIRGRGLAKIVLSWTDELEFYNTRTGGLGVRVRKYLKNS